MNHISTDIYKNNLDHLLIYENTSSNNITLYWRSRKIDI